MEEINYGHKPVLLHECLDALAIKPDGVYLDGTLGRAGHTLEIVRRLTAGGRLIALDRDETAIEAAQRRLADYMDRVTLVHSNFSALDDVLRELGVRGVDGMLFDLGVSSPQLDDAARGFSYKQDAPLDMRMDESASYTARELVNTVSYEELKRILYEYGEERYAPAVAKKICAYRTEKPIETTLELADLIRSAMPAAALREKQHPGHPHRGQRRARRASADAPRRREESQAGRAARGHYVPFARGPHRQARAASARHGLHLSAGVSGVRVRQEAQNEAHHPQAHRLGRGGAERKSPRPQRQAACGGKMLRKQIFYEGERYGTHEPQTTE